MLVMLTMLPGEMKTTSSRGKQVLAVDYMRAAKRRFNDVKFLAFCAACVLV